MEADRADATGDTTPMATPPAFRRAARMLAGAVTVAAASSGGRVHAITATAFCTLSLRPPMVLLSVRGDGQLIDLVRGAGHVGVSVLGDDQQEVGEWASTAGRRPARELPVATRTSPHTGAPLVEGAVAWFDCRVHSIASYGDHAVIVGLVEEAVAADSVRPLLYFDGAYHHLGERRVPGPRDADRRVSRGLPTDPR